MFQSKGGFCITDCVTVAVIQIHFKPGNETGFASQDQLRNIFFLKHLLVYWMNQCDRWETVTLICDIRQKLKIILRQITPGQPDSFLLGEKTK